MEQYQRDNQKLLGKSKFGDDFAASSLVPGQSKWATQTKRASTNATSHKKRKSHESSSSDDELLLKPGPNSSNQRNSRSTKVTKTSSSSRSQKTSSTSRARVTEPKPSTSSQTKGKKPPLQASGPNKSATTMSRRISTAKKSAGIQTKQVQAEATDGLNPSGSSDNEARSIPRPFPMDLNSISGPSRTTPSITSRSSPVTSARSSVSAPSRSRRHSPSSEAEDADITFTQYITRPKIDPEKLCPFCDELLPAKPSRKLLNMLQRLRSTSEADPRMGNKLGLKAVMDEFTPFCSRHEAESREFPRGRREGWPTELDVDTLTKRTLKLERRLQEIIDDPSKGTFLLPLRKADKTYGKGAVSGARAQWLNFENTSAGYYGEQGFSVMMHLLLDLFPNIPPTSMAPLNQSDYFAVVLVPEAALLLIHQDLLAKTEDDVPQSRALQVLRDSRRYGEAMFPVEEDLGENVADDVARRRATKIRRQNEDSNSGVVDLSDSEDEPKTPKVRESKTSSSEERATASSQRSKPGQASANQDGKPEQKKKKKISLKSQPEAFSSFDNGAKSKKVISNAWLWTP